MVVLVIMLVLSILVISCGKSELINCNCELISFVLESS